MISKNDVKKVAKLSRIHLEDEAMERFTHHLEDILGYIETLNELDVTDVQPTCHVVPVDNVTRPDTVKPSLSRDVLMKGAVEHLNGSFKVPKVIE